MSASPPPEPTWRKSSRSAANGCVEVASLADLVAIRDSKDRGGATLLFSPAAWRDFLGGVRAGEFDPQGAPPGGPSRRG
jgi:Domain of unknown function (DUF397)